MVQTYLNLVHSSGWPLEKVKGSGGGWKYESESYEKLKRTRVRILIQIATFKFCCNSCLSYIKKY